MWRNLSARADEFGRPSEIKTAQAKLGALALPQLAALLPKPLKAAQLREVLSGILAPRSASPKATLYEPTTVKAPRHPIAVAHPGGRGQCG